MVKFCKKFEAQIIAEWSDAYMDYRLLKKGLKNIHAENNHQDNSSTMTEQTSCSTIFSSLAKLFQYGQKHRHHGPIQVHRKEDTYETELQEQFVDVEAEREFFALLDSQVNKVNLFYKAKEKEFLEWRDSLRKQMEILIVNSPSNRNNNQGEIMFQGDKTNLQDAENMIKGSFIELYKGLRCLKSYRHLNMLGIVKILKKFDKATNKEVMPIYLKVVESSYFNISDKVARLTDEVKELLVQQFGEYDHRKAMTYLKPNQGKKSHGVTFFTGLFAGCFIALLIGYVIMAHIVGMYKHPSDTAYMETVYPVLSMFSLLFLHLFLYGCNIFVWKKARINYSFIFNLTPTKELKYRDVFLICAASMAAVAGVLFFHLSLVAKGYTSAYVQTIPRILLLLFLLLLICPFNTVYKSSRYRFLSVIRNIAFSPLYKVDMLDFFMADQLCSQVPLLRNLEYITCYYMTGSYKTQDYNYCITNTLYRDLAYAVSFLPYYWRAMQCARRWHDEGETNHLVNLGKYGSAMLAAGAKVAYEKEESVGYLCLVVALSSVATVYQLYWDYVKDWGLLQLHSKNLWLRDELMIRRKSIYYFSMVLNLVLRLAWIQTVLHTTFGRVEYRVMGLLFAALEVIRRGQWNLYRLENEQVSNNGKFRAVKTVPLPFSEEDEED